MTIATLADYKAALKNNIALAYTTNVTSVAGTTFSAFAGTLAGANTANGVVPTAADTGYADATPDTYTGLGYLTRALLTDTSQLINSENSNQLIMFDMIFKAGAYSFNSNVTLASQPSYSGRVPGGTDYTNTEIWIETVTAFTGNLTVTVTYTNESGTISRTTGSFAPAVAPTLRRAFRLPLQSGDTGVQKIESVVSTVATAGTFNVLVLRRLAMSMYQVETRERNDIQDMLKLGMPWMPQSPCLTFMVLTPSTSTRAPCAMLEIASG